MRNVFGVNIEQQTTLSAMGYFGKMTFAIMFAIVLAIVVVLIFLSVRHGNPIQRAVRHVMRTIDGKTAVLGNDGRYYYVLADKSEVKEASAKIESVNKFMIEFIIKLKQKYLYNEKTCFLESTFSPDDEFIPFSENCLLKKNPLSDYKYRAVYLLVTRYRPNYLEENQPTSSADTSWEEGKGERIALCMREQNSGKYNFISDKELVKFVAIHELTHIAANTLIHPFYFWKVFKFLLNEANLLMDYKLVDYSKTPTNYCGMNVTNNPVYDDSLDIQSNGKHDIVSMA